MAIIDSLPGVEVAIIVDGKPLKEYTDGDLDDDPKSLRRYIEAVSGKLFEVRLKIAKGTDITRQAISFRISMDGRRIRRPFVEAEHFKGNNYQHVSQGKRLDGDRIQKYCFSGLETASDGRVTLSEASRMKDIGTIVVRVYFEDFEVRLAKATNSDRILKLDPGIVSEKALKGRAVTHGIGFRAPEPRKNESTKCKSKNRDKANEYEFVFAYHSLKALKDMLIIEPTPEPTAIEDRDFESLTREDIMELQKRARNRAQADKAMQEATVKVKRERKDHNQRPRKAARYSAGSTQLEIDEDGVGFREASNHTLGHVEQEIIEIN